MKRILAQSERAAQTLALVEALQEHFVTALEELGGDDFPCVEWFRDEGRHGGGRRFSAENTPLLGRASVNVSQVHYDDDPGRRLASASAISTIVHPVHPLAPSVHIHISWTEQKSGDGYWRIMADLNPSIASAADKERFASALLQAAPDYFSEAKEQGDRYFYIPALDRHRGIQHFYLESFNTGDFKRDYDLASRIAIAAMDTYISILANAAQALPEPTAEQTAVQLAYHTLYFFQVLTLDRGTTTGLLVHNQNDVGILGSLPPRIDKNLLCSWRSRMPEPQDRLLDRLIAALPNQGVCTIDHAIKQNLADAVRAHYTAYPDALEFQASGNASPPTIDNHR